MKTINTIRNYKTYSDGTKCNNFMVDEHGVKSWDEVAGHYTSCHSLSDQQKAMIRAEARKTKEN